MFEYAYILHIDNHLALSISATSLTQEYMAKLIEIWWKLRYIKPKNNLPLEDMKPNESVLRIQMQE